MSAALSLTRTSTITCPDNFTQTAAMETIVSTFSDMGVAVYEQAPDAETLLLNDAAAAVASDDQAVLAAV